MKRNDMKRTAMPVYLRPVLAVTLVLLAVALLSACRDKTNKETETETYPSVIETVPDGTEPETEPETETQPDVSAVVFPAVGTPDYADYITSTRISQVLGSQEAVVMAVGAKQMYKEDTLIQASGHELDMSDGEMRVDMTALSSALEKQTDLTGSARIMEAASALGVNALVYDGKLAMFYTDRGLDVYDDMYTLEAMYLYMTGASQQDIVNAFIDLPDVITNGENNAVFYTAPDLNLGVQSSVYYAQLGQVEGVGVGPRLVVGEGHYTGTKPNHTVVRVLNEQQTVTAQFLAFDASVTGGVQVAAVAVGEETLIATTPFEKYNGTDGDVRVFDIFGSLRMDITLRDVMDGPYTIVSGAFVPGKSDEVLLVTAQKLDDQGRLPYALLDLLDGSVVTRSTLDCAFGLSDTQDATGAVQLSVRNTNDGTADSLILYFPDIRAVYEGSPYTATFENAGITPPENTLTVSASANLGERYIVCVAEDENEENRSFVVVYDQSGADGGLLDVGFRENVFYTARYWNDNDNTYVSTGEFMHIRCDLTNGVISQLNQAGTLDAVNQIFDNATYADYAFNGIQSYIDSYQQKHLFLEPCFTHRWNKIAATNNLVNCVYPGTDERVYASVGESGKYNDYLELGSTFNIGTYADGLLDLAKLRLYPLRSFLRTMVVEFRGENGNPEHLVGVSPVHEHEIDVAGTVGDYNVSMLRGFQIYLMELYGSIENINAAFSTSFSDEYEIDPPREQGRGDWDALKGDYFQQWTLYNRYIVSKRIMEAYREALLAGYPPESISAHQIPEGEAVAGFLGEADTRISPIDVVTTCGTAYGGTRYGTFMGNANFISIANRAGQWNMSIGEYSALQDTAEAAFSQLRYLWSNGVRMIHQITFTDAQAEAEKGAVEMLAEQNLPRPGYTGGTTGSVGVSQNGKQYNIIQMGEGAGSQNEGLLKSVTSDGKWEGTVYVVPFHAHVNVTVLDALHAPMEGTGNTYSTGVLDSYLKNSDVIELTLKASYTGEGKAYVRFAVYNQGCEMPASIVEYEIASHVTPYRYVLYNQLYMEGAEIRISFRTEGGSDADLHVSDVSGTLQQDAVGVKYFDANKATRNSVNHKGGVTFDLIDRDMKA